VYHRHQHYQEISIKEHEKPYVKRSKTFIN